MTLALVPFESVQFSPGMFQIRPAELDDRDFVVLDLRSPAAATSAGWSVAQYSGDAPASHVVLSVKENPVDLRPGGSLRQAWSRATGKNPVGDTLADWIDGHFDSQADHTGATGARPVWPKSRQGFVDYSLGPYSFRRTFVATGSRSPVSPHVRQLQADYAAIRAVSGAVEARRWLTRIVESRSIKGRQYELIQGTFVSDGRPLPHSTAIAESFDKANGTTLGPDLSWTEHLADFTVSSNSLAFSQAAHGYCSANNDLGSDHYSIANLPFGTTSFAGPTTRTSATAGTGSQPCCYAVYHVGSGLYRLRKYTQGQTFSEIASATVTQPSGAYPLKLTANGSSLVVNVDGTDRISATDSTLATPQRCGCFIYGTSPKIDSFSAGDCGGGGVHCYGSSVPPQIDWER